MSANRPSGRMKHVSPNRGTCSSGCSDLDGGQVPHGRDGDDGSLDRYAERALKRVWRAQHFSYWMTTMLHGPAGASDFDRERQRAELELVTRSSRGSAYLADGYTGGQHLN